LKSINASKIINYAPLIFFHPVAKVWIICSLAASGAYFSHRTQLIRARGLFKMHPALLTYENVWPLEINDAYAAKAPHQSTANCYSVFIGNNNIRRAKDSYPRSGPRPFALHADEWRAFNEKHACANTRVRRTSALDFFSRNLIKAPPRTLRRDGIMNSLSANQRERKWEWCGWVRYSSVYVH
jgi:hypothetical protein